ncbi:MAG: hypothetical protein ACOY82_07070 [Pseudomonadota bacterium]
MKRVLPLLLLAAWAPAALAFPPCPIEPVDLVPIDGGGGEATTTAASVWYRGHYALVGDPRIIDQIKPELRSTDNGDLPKSGKCRDRDALPVLDGYSGDATVDLSPRYAPASGFGIVGLPDLRIGDGNTVMSYTLSFDIVNNRLEEHGDWFDVAQLQFQWTAGLTEKGNGIVSAIYRVRVHQADKESAIVDVIEARSLHAPVDDTIRPVTVQRVVASIQVASTDPSTPIVLRWEQAKKPSYFEGGVGLPTAPTESTESTATVGFDGGPVTPTTDVDSSLEILDGSLKVLGRIDLPGQWASELSMGLLNYHVVSATGYAARDAIVLERMELRAKQN